MRPSSYLTDLAVGSRLCLCVCIGSDECEGRRGQWDHRQGSSD